MHSDRKLELISLGYLRYLCREMPMTVFRRGLYVLPHKVVSLQHIAALLQRLQHVQDITHKRNVQRIITTISHLHRGEIWAVGTSDQNVGTIRSIWSKTLALSSTIPTTLLSPTTAHVRIGWQDSQRFCPGDAQMETS